MPAALHIEVISAGCPICDRVVEAVRRLAAPEQTVSVSHIGEEDTLDRAARLGVRAIPAVVVDGRLADCCTAGATEDGLRAAGIGS